VDQKELDKKKATADTLDSIMMTMFGFMKDLKEQKAEIFLDQLLFCFETIILTASNTKYCQFLLFYFCHLDSAFTIKFLGYLLKRITDPVTSSRIKTVCSGYIGTYLGRANYLNEDLIRNCLDVLFEWSREYVEQCSDNYQDVDLHGNFYAVIHSIFYVICIDPLNVFRKGGEMYGNRATIEKIIKAPINPLKFFPAETLAELYQINTKLGIPSLVSIMQKNEYINLPTKARLNGDNHVDYVFPFDPYLLQRSSVFIQPLYKNFERYNTNRESNDIELGSSFSASVSQSPPDISGMSLEESSIHFQSSSIEVNM